MPSAQDIMRRMEVMEGERKTWESTWQEVSDNLLGRRNFQTQFAQGGRQRLDRIYDGTGMRSHNTFVALVSSLLTNPATEWFLLATTNPALMKIRRVALWVQGAQEHLRNAFNDAKAGFQPHMHEMYTDEIAFGTGAIAVMEDPSEGLYFHSHNLAEVFLEEDHRGRIDTVYRKTKLTARQVEQKYPGKSMTAAKAIASNQDATKLTVVQALFPNPDLHRGGFQKPIASVHIVADNGKAELLREGGFHEMPLLTPRWEKDAGELYGRGPGIYALPDQKMANQMNKTMLKAGQKAVDPPWMVSNRGDMSTLRTFAGGVTSVRFDGNPKGPIEALESKAKFPIGIELLKARQTAIEGTFHVDLLELFRQPNMTATHVLEIVEQANRALSPVLGRQQTELLEPLVWRSFMIELRSGRMPLPPPELIGQGMKVEYQSPVARAQKKSEKQALREGLVAALEVANTQPDVLDNYDIDKIARMDWELGSLPVTGMRPVEEVQAIREARAQQVAEQQALQQGLAVADAASKFQGGQAA